MSKEKEERIMYMIFRIDGSMMLGTERFSKGYCIDEFVKNSRFTWRQWYRDGFRCRKVEVTYKEL